MQATRWANRSSFRLLLVVVAAAGSMPLRASAQQIVDEAVKLYADSPEVIRPFTVKGEPVVVGDYPGLWRRSQCCGVNCVYLLLVSQGKSVAYEDVASAMPIEERGSSLADIAKCAWHFGTQVGVGRRLPEELASVSLPAIVHMDVVTGAVEGSHYSILAATDVDEGYVLLFDGVTGIEQTYSTETFLARWTGYIVWVEKGASPVMLCVLVVSAVLTLVLLRRRRRGSHAVRRGLP